MASHPRKTTKIQQRKPIQRLAEEADPATFFKEGGAVPANFAEAVAAGLDTPPAIDAKPAHTIPLAQQIRRYPPPQAECDCHGLTAAEAEEEVHRFLTRARRTAMRTVRIITGKGLHSPDGPVLRDMVEGELRLLQKKGAILAFRWEKKEKLRSGSVIVYL